MNLSVKERLNVPSILPREGTYSDMVVKADIISKVTLPQEEIAEIGLKQVENGLTWDPSKAKDKEIEFSKLETELMSRQLKALDETGKLTDDTVSLYEKFK